MDSEILNNNFEKSYIANLIDKLVSLNNEEERMIFVLHEIVKNSKETISDLREKGYKTKLIELLKLIDEKDLDKEEYIDKIINSKNKTAIKVVMANVDNQKDYNRLKEAYDKEITDGVVILKRNEELSENPDLTLSASEAFDIVCDDKIVGVINYRYRNTDKIDYNGNINYRIKEEYRGNGYAKRALNLLIGVLEYNTKYDEPLYISSTHENKNYLKVASCCGGILVHSGKAPNSVTNMYHDEMKNVDVYQINIEKRNKYDRHKIN